MRILLFLLLFTSLACSSQQMALKSDYHESLASYRRGDYQKAKEEFPNKEKDGFITSTEKLFLDIVDGDPQPYRYITLAENLEKRQVTYISQEANNFFYMETEEGYYPAEHEVIAFHILLGYAFAKKGLSEEACVEARRAGEYLESNYDSNRKEFDDPALRLWLAGLFTYCGEWEHAKVDLRVAAEQLVNPKLKALSYRNKPPAHLHLALLGDGPDIKWRGDIYGKHTNDLDKVEFISDMYSEIEVKLIDDNKTSPILASATSEGWYLRHQDRNTTIREILDKSKYMVKTLGASSQAALHKSGAALVSATSIVGGIVLGTVIIGGSIYLLIQTGANCGSSCGEFFGLIIGIGYAAGETLVKFGQNLFTSENKKANEELQETLDLSKTYRYVRFLPEKIVLGASENPMKLEEEVMGVKAVKEPFLTLKNGQTQVHLYQWTP